MNRYTLRGLVALAFAFWALQALTAEPGPQTFDAIVAADCGAEPAYDKAHTNAWYAYGDCSGDYGIVDAAE